LPQGVNAGAPVHAAVSVETLVFGEKKSVL
jgi:hypothetical protein